MAPRSSTEARLARILEMVPWIAAHDGPTVDEVCERFALTPVQLAADIELLYLCGLHPYTPDELIEAEISEDGRVHIRYADYLSRPLRLTPAEGLALLASANVLLASGSGHDGPLARGLAKLRTVIEGGDALDVRLGDAPSGVLDELRSAAAERALVEIEYYAFGRDELTRRAIEPAQVFSANGQWYVSAFCHLADDERLFRIDRIRSLTTTGRPATHPPAESTTVVFHRRPDTDAELELDPSAAWVVSQYPTEEVVDLPDGRLRVRLAVSESAWLDRLLLRLGPAARVVSSPPGWPGIAPAAQRILERYQGRAER